MSTKQKKPYFALLALMIITVIIFTNSPLQALFLLNDPQVVEASRILSERILRTDKEIGGQITLGFRAATGITPTSSQLSILTELYESSLRKFETNPTMVDSLLFVGDKAYNRDLDKTQIAAMTIVASTIFNFDESYIKR